MGRYCSYVFWAKPVYKFRVVVAYSICNGKPIELQTKYKQLKIYGQKKNTKTGPKTTFPRRLF